MEIEENAESGKLTAEIRPKINVVAIFLDAAISLEDWQGAWILRGLLLRRPALPSPQPLNGSTPQQPLVVSQPSTINQQLQEAF